MRILAAITPRRAAATFFTVAALGAGAAPAVAAVTASAAPATSVAMFHGPPPAAQPLMFHG